MGNNRFLNEMKLTCDEIEKLSSDYIDGELEAEVRKGFDAHLESCMECEQLISDINRIIQLAKSLGNMRMPDGVRQRLRDALQEKIESEKKNQAKKRNLRLVKSDSD